MPKKPALTIIQHNPVEGLGRIGHWCEANNMDYQLVQPFHGDRLPELTPDQRLIVLGGPMNVGEPELDQEQEWLQRQVDKRVPILGICLGGQMLAQCLGAEVTPLPQEEWGWKSLKMADDHHRVFAPFSDVAAVFEWHSYQFSLPQGSEPLGATEQCDRQGFVLDDRFVGIQFHPEWTQQSLTALANQSGHWPPGLKECAASNIAKLDQAVFEFLGQWWELSATGRGMRYTNC
ncbi:MAG: type 1 glutamine amidotransferase [Chromatiales bacterium]|nr:type 1 glutamine amidotransferase [Chromatiales bacterium]